MTGLLDLDLALSDVPAAVAKTCMMNCKATPMQGTAKALPVSVFF